MENKYEGNLKISGAGSGKGGRYDEIKISGAGTVDGDVECRSLRISGAGDMYGSVKAEQVKISGGGEIKGNLECSSVEISGSGRISGDMFGKDIRISGGSDIKGNLKGDNIKVSGDIKVQGDCEAETFVASGTFQIGGLLNADEIDIKTWGYCSVSEIGGQKITVREGECTWGIGRIINGMLNQKHGLRCTIIEGDDIYLEETRAKIVRGNNITIGRGCEIELVEYKNELKVDNEKSIKESKRV